jgi:ABC-2 type transport system ATP-binding protein
VIRVHQLTKRYGTVCALQDVALEIRAGEVLGLIGPNGAGKTTLLRLVAGLSRPSSGSVTFERPDDPGGEVRVGYLPQRVAFTSLATPREVIALFARLRGLPNGAAGEALRVSGLQDEADRPVCTLSGGMRQRLGLAIACLGDPRVLLLDEPGDSLDPRAAIELRRRVRAMAAQGHAVVLSSHSLPELETTCDRLAILLAGRLVLEGRVCDLRAMSAGDSLEHLFMEATS